MTSPDDEASFVDDFLAGRAGGLDAAYRAFGATLYSIALHLLRDRDDAQDCVHETLVRVWQRPAGFSAERGTLRAYLATCVRNEALGRVRGAARRRAIEARLAAREIDPADDVAVSDPIERARLRRALSELPGEQRVALELAYFSHLTQREIAERLAVPLGTVKSRVALGLRRLASALPHGANGGR